MLVGTLVLLLIGIFVTVIFFRFLPDMDPVRFLTGAKIGILNRPMKLRKRPTTASSSDRRSLVQVRCRRPGVDAGTRGSTYSERGGDVARTSAATAAARPGSICRGRSRPPSDLAGRTRTRSARASIRRSIDCPGHPDQGPADARRRLQEAASSSGPVPAPARVVCSTASSAAARKRRSITCSQRGHRPGHRPGGPSRRGPRESEPDPPLWC